MIWKYDHFSKQNTLSIDPIGKPKCMNDNMFVMCHIGKYELALVINVDEIRVNNKMHACYRFKVE